MPQELEGQYQVLNPTDPPSAQELATTPENSPGRDYVFQDTGHPTSDRPGAPGYFQANVNKTSFAPPTGRLRSDFARPPADRLGVPNILLTRLAKVTGVQLSSVTRPAYHVGTLSSVTRTVYHVGTLFYGVWVPSRGYRKNSLVQRHRQRPEKSNRPHCRLAR